MDSFHTPRLGAVADCSTTLVYIGSRIGGFSYDGITFTR